MDLTSLNLDTVQRLKGYLVLDDSHLVLYAVKERVPNTDQVSSSIREFEMDLLDSELCSLILYKTLVQDRVGLWLENQKSKRRVFRGFSSKPVSLLKKVINILLKYHFGQKTCFFDDYWYLLAKNTNLSTFSSWECLNNLYILKTAICKKRIRKV